MTDDRPTPAEALEAIARSRREVQDRVAAGGWGYDLGYAALTAGMVAGQVFEAPMNVVASSLGVLGLGALFQHESRRTGVRISGVSPRRARWVAVGCGLLFAAVMLGLAILRRALPGTEPGLLAIGAAVATFGIAVIGSRVWRRVYRAERGGGR